MQRSGPRQIQGVHGLLQRGGKRVAGFRRAGRPLPHLCEQPHGVHRASFVVGELHQAAPQGGNVLLAGIAQVARRPDRALHQVVAQVAQPGVHLFIL